MFNALFKPVHDKYISTKLNVRAILDKIIAIFTICKFYLFLGRLSYRYGRIWQGNKANIY